MSDTPTESTEKPAGGTSSRSVFAAMATDDRFRAGNALTLGTFLDAGLPLVLFSAVYMATGQELTTALVAALAAGVVLAVIRVVRGEPLQNVVAGFLGLGIAAFVANRTGRPEDVFLPGLLINVGYGVAYVVSIVVRWPLLGVFVGLLTGQGMGWRSDPALVRAYSKASAVWVAMFALRLAVQVPLYLAGEDQLAWLAGARFVMSWPLFLLVAYLSWIIIRPAYRAHQERIATADSE